MNYPWQNVLYIDAQGKTIPYQRSVSTDDTVGPGFINLKQKPASISAIPEALADIPLATALAKINEIDTGIFSVGCHVQHIADQQGYRTSAYLEFSFNDQHQVKDAAEYFSLFYQFHQRLIQARFPHSIHFDWTIMPAVFTDINSHGFTCSVKINSAYYPDQIKLQAAWASALSLLTEFLVSVKKIDGEKIY
ncbi:MAG: hypothetical protein DRR06_11045 [Gammaproteobacteria bacterium]|nr:MAG: hypothetical protein DRR06_11045 [Gammaproteobacteria bacterium]RLA52253.1 MAG: hypothetical protein DRR42_08040 [Gammaproteobacteria bacterium]